MSKIVGSTLHALAPRVSPEGLTGADLAVIIAEIYADILRDTMTI